MHSIRTRRWLLAIWLCFLVRGWFYCSMLPLWEGYDEFSHFGVIRAIAVRGILLPPRDQAGPRDVEESLKLAPVPWEVRGWEVFRTSLTEEEYWNLPVVERTAREDRLRNLPPAWQRQDSTGGISAYEAYQPPLYYWLMAPVVYALRGAGLLAQVMALRWIGVALTSLAIPLTFAIALALTRCDRAALGCCAVLAVMPELASNVARISNEPLAILLFTLLVWVGIRILQQEPDVKGAGLLGGILGLGLLTKAYFLAAVPAVLLLLVYRYRNARAAMLTGAALPVAIAGWWYARNAATTGTLSGLAEPVMLRRTGAGAMLSAIPSIPWRHATDVILTTHLYFCGWSSLTVRGWMYHVFFAVVALVAVGLVAQLRRPGIWLWPAAIYGFFWLGQLYNVVLQYMTKGLAGSMGWYMYAVVGAEVTLCAVAFGRWRVPALWAGAVLFALLDLYGMHWLAIPYYTGIIGHRANGALAAMHVGEMRALGFHAIFERLAVNKCAVISRWFLMVLWFLYLAGTVGAAAMVWPTRERKGKPA